MHRCIQLALLGQGAVEPNPMVGAVLVHGDRIIGEGYHQQYGRAHAEVNCIEAVREEDRLLIPESTLYVSLEPCAHFGKTPPCADLVIEKGIRRVVVGCRDPFPAVAGKGIEKLRAAGAEVISGCLEELCKQLNAPFFTFHTAGRPYITLKWAQSSDGKIGAHNRRTAISGEAANRIVHKWRSQHMSILVGTNTALTDDPALTTRLWPGKSPLRLVLDRSLRLPHSLQLFNGEHKTVVFTMRTQEEGPNLLYHRLDGAQEPLPQIIRFLAKEGIQSLLVEGGRQLLQAFIDEGLWDEARVITAEKLTIGEGIEAPLLKKGQPFHYETIGSDTVRYYYPAGS